MIAEWEPAIGTIITSPFYLPDELVQELAEDDLLFILVYPGDEQEAEDRLADLEIDLSRVFFFPCLVETNSVRDFAPHQIFDERGQWTLLDHVFQGQPLISIGSYTGGPGFTLNYGGAPPPIQDDSPEQMALELKAPLRHVMAYLPGGNFLVDGQGTAFCSEALVQENSPLYKETELRGLLSQSAGINRLYAFRNVDPIGIQHIDCWLKLLDQERVLVKRPPENHPAAKLIEDNVEVFRSLKTPYGRPYEILRIDCPEVAMRDSWDRVNPTHRLAAYTNSLILNRKILVPLFGVDFDQQALATWSEAMPGYEVIGYPWKKWYYDDALHCRVRAVFDRHMLYLAHARLPNKVPFCPEGYPIVATIDDRSEMGLYEEQLNVFHRCRESTEWRKTRLRSLYTNDQYTSTLPAYASGAEIEYFISVADRSGRKETLPRTAPKALYRFTICEKEERRSIHWTERPQQEPSQPKHVAGEAAGDRLLTGRLLSRPHQGPGESSAQ